MRHICTHTDVHEPGVVICGAKLARMCARAGAADDGAVLAAGSRRRVLRLTALEAHTEVLKPGVRGEDLAKACTPSQETALPDAGLVRLCGHAIHAP